MMAVGTESDATRRLGFVGLGRMGEPMAANLLAAGHTLLVHNRSPAAPARLAAAGAIAAPSLAEVVTGSDVFMSCLLTPAQIEAVYFGPGGILEHVRPGQIVIDFATVEPELSQRLNRALTERSAQFLDAPVSGGPERAAKGTLAIMAGGLPETFDAVHPILEVVGQSVFHIGLAGSGTMAKLCNQLLTSVTHAVLAETMVMAAKAGLDLGQLYEVLRVSSGNSNTLVRAVPTRILQGDFRPGFTVEGALKDIDCCLETASRLGLSLDVVAAARARFDAAVQLGYAQLDATAVVRPIEQAARVEARLR